MCFLKGKVFKSALINGLTVLLVKSVGVVVIPAEIRAGGKSWLNMPHFHKKRSVSSTELFSLLWR